MDRELPEGAKLTAAAAVGAAETPPACPVGGAAVGLAAPDESATNVTTFLPFNGCIGRKFPHILPKSPCKMFLQFSSCKTGKRTA